MKKLVVVAVSLLAVGLLVLGSQTNVVGYQSIKSSEVNESPLFSIRTQRANNQQQNLITSHYLGKGKSCNLLILPRPDKIASLSEIINRIRTMDESSFKRFVDYVVIQINRQDNLKNVDIKELINELYNLRRNTGTTIINKEINNNNRTIFYNYVPTACWFPGCYIFDVLFLILISIMVLLGAFNSMDFSVCFCP